MKNQLVLLSKQLKQMIIYTKKKKQFTKQCIIVGKERFTQRYLY